MRHQPGAFIGPYQIIVHIGSGGMGDVYRARDPKLQRDVAVKVLPEAFAADPDRVARFEREALAVAALSHPGILSIHDFGKADGQLYAVMELLEGETLRHRLESGLIPARRAIDIAAQIARALAAAHGKGIVHRDIKPENVFLTADGRVKVLDFGLVRLAPGGSAGETSASTATRLDTAAGVVLGTVGYMSPEQVRGLGVDHRSDIFSLGVVLYELLAGTRPFRGDSAVETMNAILTQDPPPLNVADASLAPAVTATVEHCLEKEAGARFQSAQDLAFNLDALRGRSDRASGQTTVAAGMPARRRRALVPLMAVAATMLVAGALVGARLWSNANDAAPLTFLRLTYDTGTLWNARFAPDGQNVVFAAAWNGNPIRTYLSRTDRVGVTPLSLPDASLFSMSSTGELAVSLGHAFDGWIGEGTLARAPILAGAPRALVEHVREADWSPDGSDLAIARRVGSMERLEFPVGTVLYQTPGYISHIRFSRDGQRIAFADHPLYSDDNGDVAVVDLGGKKTTLSRGLQGLRGVAWSPDGREVWFTAGSDKPYSGVVLRASTLDGRVRTVLGLPTDWRILDVAADGRALMSSELVQRQIELWRDDRSQPQDFTLFDQSLGSAISKDGTSVLLSDQGSIAGTIYATYLRRADQSEAVRLGDGQAVDFSADGQWALSIVYGPPSRLLLLPVGAGNTRELPNPRAMTIQAAAFLPDGRRVVFLGGVGGEPLRLYTQDIANGEAKAFGEPGVSLMSFAGMPVSPDGSRVWVRGVDNVPRLYPIAGGAGEPVKGLNPGERVIRWSDNGELFVSNLIGIPQRITRVDIATGRRTPHKELMPSQAAGVRRTELSMTPDGRTVLFSYSRLLASLYVVNGLK
jgi:eukaryotic-like serine/threonine-protein kinase